MVMQVKDVSYHWESEDIQLLFFNPPVFQEKRKSIREGKDNYNGSF